MKEKINYVPALPEFYVVELMSDKRSAKPYKLPIIAWEISQKLEPNGTPYTVVCPVTIEGPDQKSAVLFPDGRVHTALGDCYPDLPAWLKAAATAERKGGGHDKA